VTLFWRYAPMTGCNAVLFDVKIYQCTQKIVRKNLADISEPHVPPNEQNTLKFPSVYSGFNGRKEKKTDGKLNLLIILLIINGVT